MKKDFQFAYAAIVVLLVALIVGDAYIFLNGKTGSTAIKDASGGYSAVFLANGQVYFGKLGAANREYTILTNIYYPYAQQARLGQNSTRRRSVSQNVALIKLGDEIQGPKDRIYINTSQIILIEHLKEDSQVVRKIRAFE